MARSLRLEYPGAIYHINNRGNNQGYIFRDDDDRELFLKLLITTIERMNWVCHAYCLMGNHHHLLIEIPDGVQCIGHRQDKRPEPFLPRLLISELP